MTSAFARLTLLLTAFLSACAGLSSSVSDDVVSSWRQLPAEVGRLDVGRVIASERVSYQRSAEPPKAAYPSPQVAAAAVAITPVFEAIRNADWIYRHNVRMKGGVVKTIEVKYTFKIGECVAFRPGLSSDDPLPIPAIPSECEGI